VRQISDVVVESSAKPSTGAESEITVDA
jgi:hypothetical protein